MKRTYSPAVNLSKRFILLFFAVMFLCTTAVKAQTTYRIVFPNSPPLPDHAFVNRNDVGTDGIETGVRFRVTQIGTIKSIWFYKGDVVTGTHVGNLWSNTGTLLASATFTEVGFGWQEVTFGTPVSVSPGNNYVASVFNADGYYTSENDTWAGGTDFGTNPIKVIAWLNDPGFNGIYLYTNSSAFPTSDGTADNYWIDVKFEPLFTLPVSLSDFRAATASSDVLLSWKTEHEFYNKGFEIQRSNNGSDWYAVNFVNGAGDGTSTRNYAYTDKNLAPGTYYYRLKQTDFDGKNTFSAIVTATVTGKGKVSLFQNYPNPFNVSTSIRFDLPNTQHARLSVFDMAGREVKVLIDKLSVAGSHIVTLDAATLSRQLYIVRLKTENAVLTQKILVK
jgi:hypothetical protein